ncbi:YfaZ family outer membrane protein [Marinomonas polaris]|uniref:YfaZ family outer membrane protein n=1 Tax=Marinomonas polaris TaxID=293552 RepID=UPI003514DB64|tara:strand:+ start:9242 stop:9805 length:564 start_codon:yes stop_codon:yes gene_type:complete
MNLTHKALLLTVGILGSSIVNASSAGVSLTNDTVKGDINLNMGAFGVNGGVTHNDDKNTSTAHIGVTVEDSDTSGPLQAGIGIRLYAIDANSEQNDDLSVALALGGWYRYTLPEANRVSIYGSVYYSPQVLSISNLDHMYTYEFRAEYMTMRNARAFIRYGKTVTVYEDDSRKEIDKGLSIGATVDF